MSYNYLGLANDVLGRFNETPLTSSTFAASVGAYSVIKEGVNSAIHRHTHSTTQGNPYT